MLILTGHRGFIGQNLLRMLNNYPSPWFTEIVAADPEIIPDQSYYQTFPEGPEIRESQDIRTYKCYAHELPQDLLDRATAVINCGAESHVDRSYNSSFEFSNVTAPCLLVERLNPGTLFLQVSTDEVFDHTQMPFTELSAHAPTNPYSETKSLAETKLRALCAFRQIPLVITNGANTYGPGQYWEKIIPKTIYNVLRGHKIPVFRTPAQRMWLHVDDHANGIIKALEALRKDPVNLSGESFCLAPDEQDELYTLDLVQRIIILLGKDPEECIEFVPDRLNYDLRYWMKNDKAKGLLGWSPERHIVDELPRVVQHYVDLFNATPVI